MAAEGGGLIPKTNNDSYCDSCPNSFPIICDYATICDYEICDYATIDEEGTITRA